MEVIGLLLTFAVFLMVCSTLGLMAFIRVQALQQELAHQRDELAALRSLASPPAAAEFEIPVSPSVEPSPTIASPSYAEHSPPPAEIDSKIAAEAVPAEVNLSPYRPVASSWLQHLLNHWMVWLGGICVGLAGIFLVSYSIEAGLLGPVAVSI